MPAYLPVPFKSRRPVAQVKPLEYGVFPKPAFYGEYSSLLAFLPIKPVVLKLTPPAYLGLIGEKVKLLRLLLGYHILGYNAVGGYGYPADKQLLVRNFVKKLRRSFGYEP